MEARAIQEALAAYLTQHARYVGGAVKLITLSSLSEVFRIFAADILEAYGITVLLLINARFYKRLVVFNKSFGLTVKRYLGQRVYFQHQWHR